MELIIKAKTNYSFLQALVVSALMDLTRIVSGMDLMDVGVEDVRGGEEEMEMEVVEEEDVKDPLEELVVLVVLALMVQTPTVSGKFLCLSFIILVVRIPDMILGNKSIF